METKPKIHHLIILDSTQTMNAAATSRMEGFKEVVAELKSLEPLLQSQHYFISLLSFNGTDKPLVYFLDHANSQSYDDNERMVSDQFAPTLEPDIKRLLGAVKGQSDYNVLLTILTNPETPSWLTSAGSTVQQVVNNMTLPYWAFAYIDTHPVVDPFLGTISVVHTTNFSKHQTDMHGVFLQEMDSSSLYIDKIQFERDYLDGFTSIPEECY